MTCKHRFVAIIAALGCVVAIDHVAAGQLASRPAEDWMARLERSERVAGLKIDYIISKLEVKPGQVVADIGAGPGVISLPLAKAVSPGGKVYAVEIDQAFLDHIKKKAKEQSVANITTAPGTVGAPLPPARAGVGRRLHPAAPPRATPGPLLAPVAPRRPP